MPEIKVSVSVLAADFTRLRDDVKKAEQAGCKLAHIDVMDGSLAPNITIGPCVIKAIRPLTTMEIDSHLMIDRPWLYLDDYIDAGSDIITVHIEAYALNLPDAEKIKDEPRAVTEIDIKKLTRDLDYIKSRGKKTAVAVNPGSTLCFKEVLDKLDMVLIMSVNPGFSGQKFKSEVLEKIKELRKEFKGDIGIDGGINDKTAPLAREAGANVLATASYFYNAKDPKQAVLSLRG